MKDDRKTVHLRWRLEPDPDSSLPQRIAMFDFDDGKEPAHVGYVAVAMVNLPLRRRLWEAHVQLDQELFRRTANFAVGRLPSLRAAKKALRQELLPLLRIMQCRPRRRGSSG